MHDEFIRVLGLDVVSRNGFHGKVGEVVGHDDTRLTANGGGEHMPVVGIGQMKLLDETLVSGHQAVRYRRVHQFARALKFSGSKVRPITLY